MRSLVARLAPFVIAIAWVHAAYEFSACSSFFKELDEVNDPSDDAKLSDCRKHMREVRKDAGGDAHAAWGAYYECTQEAGLR